MIKLTTIIANYNYAHFLKEAALSISTHEECEVLIVDDASTDNSRALIKELSETHPNIRYHFKEKNGGIEETFNTGIALARGEYIHLFASDDIYLSGSLAVIFDYMNRFPKAPFFCSDFAYFSDISKIAIQRQLPRCKTPSFYSPNEAFKLFQTTNFWIPGHTVIAKKSVYLNYIPQDKQLGSLSDWLINHTMALKEGVGYIPQGLIAMRQHAHNYSSSLNLERKRKMWLYLLETLENNKQKYQELYKSGIMRMIGLRSIFKDFLITPRYWKYIFPMIKREFLKR